MQLRPVQLQRDLRIQQTQLGPAIRQSCSVFDKLLEIGASESKVDVRSPAIRGQINRLDVVDLKFKISELGQLTADIAHDVPLAEIMTKRLKRITMDDSIQQTRPREHTFLMRNQL